VLCLRFHLRMELEYASGISLDLISEGNSVVKWFDDWAIVEVQLRSEEQ